MYLSLKETKGNTFKDNKNQYNKTYKDKKKLHDLKKEKVLTEINVEEFLMENGEPWKNERFHSYETALQYRIRTLVN